MQQLAGHQRKPVGSALQRPLPDDALARVAMHEGRQRGSRGGSMSVIYLAIWCCIGPLLADATWAQLARSACAEERPLPQGGAARARCDRQRPELTPLRRACAADPWRDRPAPGAAVR